MGEKKRKRDRFLEAHPRCCFCGGTAPATTIDHVPNRASFAGRAAPEEFEFPACVSCQTSTRLDEIAFSSMVHLLAADEDLPNAQSMEKLFTGLKNNLPDLAKVTDLTTREKRHAIRELDLLVPSNEAIRDLTIIEINPAWHDHMERYLAKLTRALFYRHLEYSAPSEWTTWAQWTYEKIQLNRSALQTWIEMTPVVEIGRRSNVELGDRFVYRVNYSDELGAFATVGQFGRGLIFYSVLMKPDLAAKLENSLAREMRQERIS